MTEQEIIALFLHAIIKTVRKATPQDITFPCPAAIYGHFTKLVMYLLCTSTVFQVLKNMQKY